MNSHSNALLVVVLVVALAGCLGGGGGGQDVLADEEDALGGGSGGSGAMATPAEGEAVGGAGSGAGQMETPVGTGEGGSSAGATGTNRSGGRALVRTGNTTIEVNNATAARARLEATTRELGGFVADSRVTNRRVGENRTWTRVRLVVRVPAENFTTLVERTRGLGEVRSFSTSTRDVAEQLVDLRARLENLYAQRERLRGLYANASDTEAVLAIEERLSEVQSQIERLEARLTELEGRVALSTLTVELVEPRPEPETAGTAVAWYETGVIDAFTDSVAGVVTTLRATAVALAYLAPYLFVFGVPLVAGVVLYRRGHSGTHRTRGGGSGKDGSEGHEDTESDDEGGRDDDGNEGSENEKSDDESEGSDDRNEA